MQELDYISKILSPHFSEWIDLYIHEKPTYPKIIELDTTSNCMYKCPECINSDLVNKSGAFTEEEMEKLIQEFGELGIVGVIFIGGGEPLLFKGFGQAIKLCASQGISAGVTTNGFLICDYIHELSQYADWTRVSVDAATSDTYNLIRPCRFPNSFARITHNMRTLAKSKCGKLGFSFLAIERSDGFSNINEVVMAAELAKDIGCDYFELKPMVDKYHFLYEYSKDNRKALLSKVDKLYKLENSRFHIVFPDSILQYKSDYIHQPKDYRSCAVCELRAVVTPHGVYPCPYKRGIESAKYGVIETTFKDLWDNRSVTIDPSKVCNFFCIRHNLNLFLESVKQNPTNYDSLKQTFINVNDVFV